MQRVGGIIQVKVNGELYSAKGSFEYNLGIPKREMVVGSDGVHGYKEMPQRNYIKGVFTDRGDISLKTLVSIREATVTLSLANGKVIVQRESAFVGDGNATTEEGEIEVEFSGISCEEVR